LNFARWQRSSPIRRHEDAGRQSDVSDDGVFADFERERVKAALERARAQGKTLGRPTISTTTDATIRKALKKGDLGIRTIATTLGVGTGTVQRIKAEMSG
jgi:DNA invertase Pin-like site-specific DNA recombinase